MPHFLRSSQRCFRSNSYYCRKWRNWVWQKLRSKKEQANSIELPMSSVGHFSVKHGMDRRSVNCLRESLLLRLRHIPLLERIPSGSWCYISEPGNELVYLDSKAIQRNLLMRKIGKPLMTPARKHGTRQSKEC